MWLTFKNILNCFWMVSLSFANSSICMEVVCISFPCGHKMRFCCEVNPFWWLFCSPLQRNEVIVVGIIILILFWGRLWNNNRHCWFASENELRLIEIEFQKQMSRVIPGGILSWLHLPCYQSLPHCKPIIRHKWKVAFSMWNLKYFYYASCMVARVKD